VTATRVGLAAVAVLGHVAIPAYAAADVTDLPERPNLK